MDQQSTDSLIAVLADRVTTLTKSVDGMAAKVDQTWDGMNRLAYLPGKVDALSEDIKHTRHTLNNTLHAEVGQVRKDARDGVDGLRGEMRLKHEAMDRETAAHAKRLHDLESLNEREEGRSGVYRWVADHARWLLPVLAGLGAFFGTKIGHHP